MNRNFITQSTKRPPRDVARFSRYLQTYALFSPAKASALLAGFASGDKIIVPDVAASLEARLQWDGYGERASLIAEHGLYSSADDAAEDKRKANAPLTAERRKALSDSLLDFGAEARADELAANLSISIAQAKATLRAEQPKSTIPTIAERAEGALEMGCSYDMFDAFSGSVQSQSNKMSDAIDRAAGIEKGNLK